MEKEQFDKKLIKWVKNHYWDSLEKDKDMIVRHLRTFTGDAILEKQEKGYTLTEFTKKYLPDSELIIVNKKDVNKVKLYIEQLNDVYGWAKRRLNEK